MAKRITVGVAIALVLAAPPSLIAYWKAQPIDVRLGEIEQIGLFPVPEGPTLVFGLRESDSRGGTIDQIAGYVPTPLPHPVWQGFFCQSGGDLVIRLRDGSEISYGPCRRPESIDRLWGHMIDVSSHGRCRPHCEPG